MDRLFFLIVLYIEKQGPFFCQPHTFAFQQLPLERELLDAMNRAFFKILFPAKLTSIAITQRSSEYDASGRLYREIWGE
ncbi:MAG: hypothetical protein WCF19_06620 [Chlamydiales bacterium]